MTAKERGVLVGIVVAVALLLRIGYIATTHVKDPLRTDAGQYARYAHNLAHHGVYSLDAAPPLRPDSFRSPGYPLFLAAALALGDDPASFPGARAAQVALGTAMVPLTWSVARMFLPFWASLTAAAFAALSPHLVTSTGYVLTETLFGSVLLAGLLLLCRGLRQRRTLLLAASGVALGCAGLVNETALLLPLPLALLLWRSGASRAGALSFVLLAAAVGSAWTWRNHANVGDQARRGSDRALITLSHGTYPGWVHRDPRYRYSAYLEDPEQPAFGASWDRFCAVLSQRVRERPLRYLSWYLCEKPYWLWSWNILQGKGDIYVFPVAESLYENAPAAEATRVAMKLLHPAVLALGLLALALMAARLCRGLVLPAAALVLALTVVYFTVVYCVFAPWPRYSVPLRPELYVLAAWAVVEIVRARQRRRVIRTCPPHAAPG